MIRKFVEAKAANQSKVTIWGTGTPTREFLFVEDAARAIVLATEKLETDEPINIGVGREISIGKLAEMIAAATGYHGSLEFDTSRPDGQPRRCLDVSRARDMLGFEAEVSLAEGLRRTIDWYRAQGDIARAA